MTRPPGGDGDEGNPESPPKSFDDVWRAGTSGEAAEDDAPEGTRRWDDDARAQGEQAAHDERGASQTSGTRLGHPGIPAGERLTADLEMDALMHGKFPEVPSDQSGVRRKVEVDEGPDPSDADDADDPDDAPGPDAPDDEASDDEDDDDEASDDEVAPDVVESRPSETRTLSASGDEVEPDDDASKRPLRVVPAPHDLDDDDDDDDDDADADDEGSPRVSARREHDEDPTAMPPIDPEPPAAGFAGKLVIGAIAVAGIVALGWALGFGPQPDDEPDNKTDKPSRKIEPPPAAPIQPSEGKRPPPPAAHPPTRPSDLDDGSGSGTAGGGESSGGSASDDDDGADAGPDRPPAAGGDPREPPPGTPPEIADAFRKLPVSAADRPPVGAIGPSGIHVDRITMGAKFVDGECAGDTKTFSVGALDRASVCVRVVHPRDKEELVVLWKKEGGAARRSKMVVKPMHAYRTRAYLKLRSEYVGKWTVQILAEGDIELATYAFTVTE